MTQTDWTLQPKAKGEVRLPKLVRDNMPAIYAKNRDVVELRACANDDEYRAFLVAKLREEVEEYAREPSAHELADILEAADALAALEGGRDAVEAERARKRAQRGGFEKRLVLVTFAWGPGPVDGA